MGLRRKFREHRLKAHSRKMLHYRSLVNIQETAREQEANCDSESDDNGAKSINSLRENLFLLTRGYERDSQEELVPAPVPIQDIDVRMTAARPEEVLFCRETASFKSFFESMGIDHMDETKSFKSYHRSLRVRRSNESMVLSHLPEDSSHVQLT